VAGAVSWTLGLFILAGVLLTAVMQLHPGAPVVVHGFFVGVVPILLALAFLAIGFFQVRSGLAGIDQLRRRLAALHDGHQARLEGSYPAEVQPLVADLNALLDQRERTVRQALARAGDLAHGLKTPLAILAHEADRAAATGHGEVATAIEQQVARMRRQVDYHLAHTRALSGHASGARCQLRASIEGLVRALERLHSGRALAIENQVAADCSVRVHSVDVEEMLGNLLDNACRWAEARVVVDAIRQPGRVLVTVDDDGPGLAPELWEKVLQRGVRADESGPGSGLGLAIVGSLAELYGGSVALGLSPLGGLRAELVLPA
jgi:signal transduction histidine kinase